MDHVDVRGLKRNSPQVVIDYVKVKSGDLIDLDRLMDIQQRLWDSGRFKKHIISITRRPDSPSKVVCFSICRSLTTFRCSMSR